MKINCKDVLFLDIETVPLYANYSQLSVTEQELFALKTEYKRQQEETSVENFYQRAGIWAEFGKIICISVGYFTNKQFRITSFSNPDEVELLENFCELINTYFSKGKHKFCGHNVKEFDFPFIARRLLIHGLPIPKKLQLAGKKPWEVPHLDTLEFWRFGDYKHYTSLKLLTHILGVESPKDDIDGSQVADVYYKEKNLDRIVRYCEKDVLAVAQVFLRMQGLPLMLEEEVVFVK